MTDKGMFVQRVVSPFKTFHRSLLSDSFLTFQNPGFSLANLKGFERSDSDNSMAIVYGKCTVHKRVKNGTYNNLISRLAHESTVSLQTGLQLAIFIIAQDILDSLIGCEPVMWVYKERSVI